MDNLVVKNREVITREQRNIITLRYRTLTKAINKEFWNSDSEVDHSLYVGSYGRGTAIKTSDIDVLISLPKNDFYDYNSMSGNSQSRLLQAVRLAILKSYPKSNVHADGQVVVVDFSDGIKFEVLPVFKDVSFYGTMRYIYPDSNKGGKWRSTNPRAEQEAITKANRESNGLLVDTCKHMRYIRDTYFPNIELKGIVIDTFVQNNINDWRWLYEGEYSGAGQGKYERMLFDKYECMPSNAMLQVPGSYDSLDIESSYFGLGKVLDYMVKWYSY